MFLNIIIYEELSYILTDASKQQAYLEMSKMLFDEWLVNRRYILFKFLALFNSEYIGSNNIRIITLGKISRDVLGISNFIARI
jgi:hypothetical protein